MVKFIILLLLLLSPIAALAHDAPLDPYGCHSDLARFGNTSARECHTGLLAGKTFISLNAEHVAYIAAQGVLITDLAAKLTACQLNCPVVGSAQLSWQANTDPDVAGYKVYHGTTSRLYQSSPLLVSGPGATIQNLSVGTHYFAVTAYDHAGNESTFSQEVSKAIP